MKRIIPLLLLQLLFITSFAQTTNNELKGRKLTLNGKSIQEISNSDSSTIDANDSLKLATLMLTKRFSEGAKVGNAAALMALQTRYVSAVVTDSVRGGNFNLIYQPGLVADSGIYFPASGVGAGFFWQREVTNSYGVNVRWYDDNVGDSVHDDTRAIERAWLVVTRNRTQNYTRVKGTNLNVLYFPACRGYRYLGTGLFDTSPSFRQSFSVIGDGSGATRLKIESNVYFINLNGITLGSVCKGMQVIGGEGFYKNAYASAIGGNANSSKSFDDMIFVDYSVCAIASNSSDDPFFFINRCKFTGLPYTTAIMLPPGGSHSITNTWITGGMYKIHLRNGGGVYLHNVSFNGIYNNDSAVHDIWIEPEIGSNDNGRNLTINKIICGGENDGVNDKFILVAFSDTTVNASHTTAPDYGSYKHSRVPVTDPNISVTDVNIELSTFAGASNVTSGIVYSYIQRLGRWVFRDNVIDDNSAKYIFEFPGITRFDSANNNLIQTNFIDLRRTAIRTKEIMLSNIPGMGMVYDPHNVLRNTTGVLPVTSFRDYSARRLDEQDLIPVTTTAEIRGTVTGADKRQSATVVKFNQSEGRVYKAVRLSGATPGAAAWVQFDLSNAADSSINELFVRLGWGYTSTTRRWVIKTNETGWKTITLPFVVPDTAIKSLKLFFAASSDNYSATRCKINIGNVRIYQAQNMPTFPDNYFPVDTAVTFGTIPVFINDTLKNTSLQNFADSIKPRITWQNLSADGTINLSGNYNGTAARTVGINTAAHNLWTGGLSTAERFNLLSTSAARFYNTVDTGTNYERISMFWNANTFFITPQFAGTGVTRNINVNGVVFNAGTFSATGGTLSGALNTNGIVPTANNSFTIGNATLAYTTVFAAEFRSRAGALALRAATVSDPIQFNQGNTEAARFSATNNNLLIATTTDAGFKLDVNGTGRFTGAVRIGPYTLPATDGTANQVLKTNGSGVVTWQDDTGTGGSGVSSVSFTDGNGFDGTITNPTTTPAVSLALNVTGGRVLVSSAGGTALETTTATTSDLTKLVALRPKATQTLTDGATITFDIANGNHARVTIGGARTLSMSNLTDGDEGWIIVTQDGTGNRTLSLPSTSTTPNGFGGGNYLELSVDPGKVDILFFVVDGTTIRWSISKDQIAAGS